MTQATKYTQKTLFFTSIGEKGHQKLQSLVGIKTKKE